MRRNQRLHSILLGYRLLAGLTAMIIASLALMGWVALAFDDPAVHDVWLPLARLTGCAVLGVVLLIGHYWLSQHLAAVHAHTEESRASAHRDALTGVFSRAYFLEALSGAVHHQSPRSVGYMQLDLDNLKVLNDSAGHAAGDAALQHLIRVVEEVMPGAVIGRLGGDEFGILILDHDNKQALRRLGEEMLRQLEKPVTICGRPVRVSASVGVAMAPLDAQESADLISKADLALYQAKRSGRSRVVAFDTEMLADERYRRFVERELRAALLMDELEVHYQPVFAAQGLQVRSHEALLRWRHRVRGMIPPAKFIPFAEQSDLIEKLGAWVLRRACLDLPQLGGAAVSVNVSPVQLRNAEFARRVEAILVETGTNPKCLILEVTETVPLNGDAVAMANLAALRAKGVRIAIDDFGAGYASLQYLRDFAFDIIKIDRAYVTNAAESRIDALIIEAICKIALSLPVDVVAEGVETEPQRVLLTQLGCTGLQGYLLGRPKPLDARQAAHAA
jgi:diguanylate cyclase (GGDEF)-like protein